MINHITVYFGDKKQTYTVGVEDVKKIFLDRENKDHVVILMEDNIVEIAGFPFVAVKDYKETEEK